MFTLVAATLFSAAFLLAVGTIAGMFMAYRDKMVAALMFEPIPQQPPVYHLRVRHPRAAPTRRAALPLPTGALAA